MPKKTTSHPTPDAEPITATPSEAELYKIHATHTLACMLLQQLTGEPAHAVRPSAAAPQHYAVTPATAQTGGWSLAGPSMFVTGFGGAPRYAQVAPQSGFNAMLPTTPTVVYWYP